MQKRRRTPPGPSPRSPARRDRGAALAGAAGRRNPRRVAPHRGGLEAPRHRAAFPQGRPNACPVLPDRAPRVAPQIGSRATVARAGAGQVTPAFADDELRAMIDQAAVHELPQIVGQLHELLALAELRVRTAQTPAPPAVGVEPLLTMDEVAEVLGVDVEHAREMGRHGKLATVTVGKRFVRVRASTLQAWIEKHESRPLDARLNTVLSRRHDQQGSTKSTEGARPDASGVRGEGRRTPDHRQQVGTRRGPDHGSDRSARLVAIGEREGQAER